MNEKANEIIRESRKFLHDISNKVLIASGLGSNVLKTLKNGEGLDEKKIDIAL